MILIQLLEILLQFLPLLVDLFLCQKIRCPQFPRYLQNLFLQAFFEVQRVLNKTDFKPGEETGEAIRQYNELLKKELGIYLSTATVEDLEKPLYSAAFSRAYFNYLMRFILIYI